MKGFTRRLVLKQNYKITRKWPIGLTFFSVVEICVINVICNKNKVCYVSKYVKRV